jgi:hypothetical protein
VEVYFAQRSIKEAGIVHQGQNLSLLAEIMIEGQTSGEYISLLLHGYARKIRRTIPFETARNESAMQKLEQLG